jgi:hypothetical protein
MFPPLARSRHARCFCRVRLPLCVRRVSWLETHSERRRAQCVVWGDEGRERSLLLERVFFEKQHVRVLAAATCLFLELASCFDSLRDLLLMKKQHVTKLQKPNLFFISKREATAPRISRATPQPLLVCVCVRCVRREVFATSIYKRRTKQAALARLYRTKERGALSSAAYVCARKFLGKKKRPHPTN